MFGHAACWRLTAGRTLKPAPGSDVWTFAPLMSALLTGIGWFTRHRPGWGLNTAKRYARAAAPQELQRPHRYRATLVDPYREHLCPELAETTRP